MNQRSAYCCCNHRPSELDEATDRQREYINELIIEVGQGWDAKKYRHAIAEAQDSALRKGEASRWIGRLLHIRAMQRFWNS